MTSPCWASTSSTSTSVPTSSPCSGPEFNGAQIYAVAKSDLLAGQPQAHVVHFDKLAIGGAVAASVQPALSRGTPAAEYFMNSLDPNGTFDNRLGVWAMTNRPAVANGGKPTLSSTVITSEPYAIPPGAQQKGSTSLLDSGDDRMQQTQFIAGELWGELGTSVTIPNDPEARAGAAWFAVHPTLNGKRIGGAVIDRQGYVVVAHQYVLYPAVQADAAGRAAMVFALTGANRFPSAAFALLPAQGSNLGLRRLPPPAPARTTRPPPVGATTPSPYPIRRRTPSGWRPSTSRRSPARLPPGNATGELSHRGESGLTNALFGNKITNVLSHVAGGPPREAFGWSSARSCRSPCTCRPCAATTVSLVPGRLCRGHGVGLAADLYGRVGVGARLSHQAGCWALPPLDAMITHRSPSV